LSSQLRLTKSVGTYGKVLSKELLMQNIKALVQDIKKNMAMVKVFKTKIKQQCQGQKV
jgi:hypothetical protein